jgi:hypothetical protein
MARTKSIPNGVKYTVVLPEESLEELKTLAGKNIIESINAGVREAVAAYIIQQKRESYKQDLAAAAQDPEFLKRTEETMDSFHSIDQETEGMTDQW